MMIWKTPVAAETPKFAASEILVKTWRLFQSIYNVPSPAHLHTWGQVDNNECKKKGTLGDISRSYSKALWGGGVKSFDRLHLHSNPAQHHPNSWSPSLACGKRHITSLNLQRGNSSSLADKTVISFLLVLYSVLGYFERCPWVKCMINKYAEICTECQNNGWKAHCEPVTVWCWVFAGNSLLRTLKLLELQLKRTNRSILGGP